MPTKKIRAILFDWGGTLVDAGGEDTIWRHCIDAAVQVLDQLGCKPSNSLADDLTRKYLEIRQVYKNHPEHRELMLDDYFDEWSARGCQHRLSLVQKQSAIDAFWKKWTHCLTLLDRSDLILSELKRRHFLIGLVSNVTAPPQYCIEQLKRLNQFQYFDTLTFSSQVGYRKPHPQMYQDAITQLQSKSTHRPLQMSEVMFVGDSPRFDVLMPSQLGMSTTLIVHPHVQSPWPAEDYQLASPTIHIKHLSELLDYLT